MIGIVKRIGNVRIFSFSLYYKITRLQELVNLYDGL